MTQLDVTDTPSESELAAISEGLTAFNTADVGPPNAARSPC